MKRQKLNIDLLKRLRTRFLRMRHPEHFDMREVAVKTDCGTAMCIAGHTLDLCGYKIRWQGDGSPLDAIWYKPNGRKLGDLWAAMDEAQRLLGMNYEQAQQEYRTKGLFKQSNLRTPKQAATAIDKVIKQAEAE